MNANGINCASDISEQGEFTPEPLPLKPAERLRAFAVALKSCRGSDRQSGRSRPANEGATHPQTRPDIQA